MFNNSNKSNPKNTINQAAPKKDVNSVNILGEGSVVEGNLESSNSFRFDGEIRGNVKIHGKCLITPTGKITGDIHCVDAEICGQIVGNITASGLVSIKASANIQGDIYYKQIEIEPGAHLDCKLQQTTGKLNTMPETNDKEAADSKTA